MVDLFGREIKEPAKRGCGDSVYKIIGASNHCKQERAGDDFYATSDEAVEWLCKLEKFNNSILEPCCGQGHISKVLSRNGYNVISRDLVDRGFGQEHNVDFLTDNRKFQGDIVTNPPYALAQQFVEHALSLVDDGNKVAMFLKLTFAEGKGRRRLFYDNPPCRVWVSSSRLECGKNGVFGAGSAVAYAWWIWVKGHIGTTEMNWFN